MKDIQDSVSWRGHSGRTYQYKVVRKPGPLPESGNFVWAKWSGNRWLPVCIGEADSLDEALQEPVLGRAVMRGGTVLHVHVNPLEAGERVSEMQDIAKFWKPVCTCSTNAGHKVS
jgi:hypothetical protein